MFCQQCVVGRVPDLVVDRVEDAGQHVVALAKQAVEAKALLGGLDLTSVGRAHGGEAVGVVQATFHERQLAVVFEPVHLERWTWQTEIGKTPRRENALVSQVVHGKDAADTGSDRSLGERQIGGHQPGMPVVGMHDLRSPGGVESLRQLRAGPTQQREAPVVVVVRLAISVFVRVTWPVVQHRRIDDVGENIGRAGGFDAAEQQSTGVAPRRLQFGYGRQADYACKDGRKARQQHAHVLPGGCERDRQGTGHVSQATGL